MNSKQMCKEYEKKYVNKYVIDKLCLFSDIRVSAEPVIMVKQLSLGLNFFSSGLHQRCFSSLLYIKTYP